MICGEPENSFDSTESLICEACDNSNFYDYCDECGERISSEEYAYIVDSTTLCANCYSNNAIYTYDDPDEPHLIDNCTPVYLRTPDEKVSSNHYVYVYDTYNDFPEKEFVEPFDGQFIVDWSNASTCLLDECGYSNSEIQKWNNYSKN